MGEKKTHGGDIWAAARSTGLGPEELLDFSASINPLGMSPRAVRAVKGALGPLAAAYPDPDSVELKRAISGFYGVAERSIIAGNGSTELIYALPRALGIRKALIVEPAFSEYHRALKLAGATARAHVLREKNAFKPDIRRLVPAIKRGGYQALYIANPANPTGAPVEKDAMLELADLCARSGTVLVVDEAFSDFAEELSMKEEASRRKDLLVLRSMTKFFAMAGLRLGFAVADERTVERFKRHMPPWSVNTLAAAAAVASLKDAAYMKRTLALVEGQRRALAEGLAAIEGVRVYPSAANFLMLRVSHPRTPAPELKERLFCKGMLVRNLADFRGLGQDYLRVAVKGREENARLVEAVSSILGS